jgi:hypothetical protein
MSISFILSFPVVCMCYYSACVPVASILGLDLDSLALPVSLYICMRFNYSS